MLYVISSAFCEVFSTFLPVFTAPSFENFVALTCGWILCAGRHTVSGAVRAALGYTTTKHFSSLYRFFSRAVWDPDLLGKALFSLLRAFLHNVILAVIDDTLCRRTGPHFWGAGMHRDPLRSTYGIGTSAGRWFAMAFGHNWVVLSVVVPLPWNKEKAIAVPVLWRLYRPEKYTPPSQYRKRTELARELIQIFASWVPPDMRIHVIGDAEYACKTTLRALPPGVDFTGPMIMNAALYGQPETNLGPGRPRKKGKRLLSPKELADCNSVPWRKVKLDICGNITVLVKEQVGMWYRVAPDRLVRMIVARDPRGRMKDGGYFTTQTELSCEDILSVFSKRWSLEVAFRDAKQYLGIEEPQNGWWRRRRGRRQSKKKPGPNPRGKIGRHAILHTLPFIFSVYGILVVWYFRYGNREEDLKLARKCSPWYRHKREISFQDMLNAARRHLRKERILVYPPLRRVNQKIRASIFEYLGAA